MLDLKNIIESLLFVSDEPLALDQLRATLETVDSKEIRVALQALSDEYAARGGGFYLQEVAGGWQIRSRPEYHEWIKRLLQPSPQRLSRASLETLAVIAYKQPIIRADIEHIRGVDCGGVLRQLMERKLIRVLGRREIAGRPLIYATTKLFLEMFDLKDLNDLPTPKEIAELGNAMVDSGRPTIANSGSEPTASSPASPQEQDAPMEFPIEAEASDDSMHTGHQLAMEVEDEMADGTDPEMQANTSRIIPTEEVLEEAQPEEIDPSEQAQPSPPETEESYRDEAEDPKNS
ncbi:MAG: SMC-Scp complex subunit ScpB [Desulfatitalea sp.]|nr:SMC-Scp complex subunit ScpB [Desulfatitalea sp.]